VRPKVNDQAVQALYYPRAEAVTAAWLKAALLYWERVLRMVPDGVALEDDDEVRELESAGLVRNVSPTPFREVAGRRFEEERLDDLLSREGAATGAGPSDGNGDFDPIPLSEMCDPIPLSEMDEGLVSRLKARKLLQIEGARARLPAEVALQYRCALVCTAGDELAAAPVAERGPLDVACAHPGLRRPGRTAGAPANGFAWARLALPFPAPGAMVTLSPARLIELRSEYAAQRRAFRTLVQERAASIFALSSPEAIRSHLDDFAKEVREQTQAQREMLDSKRIRAIRALFGISGPLSITTALASLGVPPLAALAGGAGAVGLQVVKWFQDRSLARPSHSHYLLSLEAAMENARSGATTGA
jgi:hypothetical protein